MRRNQNNLKLYRGTCEKVIDRASERCEVMLDEDGNGCSDKPKIKRCGKYIGGMDKAQWINFAHKKTRNGATDAEILNPSGIIYTCGEHHLEEERTGKHLEAVEYSEMELNYIEDPN